MAYKPYKMKGHTLPGINQRSEGNTDLPDGRSGSSPFQYKYPKSPTKKKGDYRESNLLKTVPNKEAYDKLSDLDKKGFDAASKKAGFPQKRVKTEKKSPNKWVQFIPMALSAVSSLSKMGKKKEE